jgi:hypothetical protein
MAKRRMFNQDIVGSDAFADMPMSSQALYFHLGMRADDDGFVGNPKLITRMVGANEDDIKLLIAKRFVLSFDSGVVVVKHWLNHNLIRADLYKETQYKKEKEMLGLNENGAYTELRDGVSKLKKVGSPKWLKKRKGKLIAENNSSNSAYRKRTANGTKTARKDRLGKDRLGKVSLDTLDKSKELQKSYGNTDINDLIEYWQGTTKLEIRSAKQRNRNAANTLIKQHGLDKAKQLVRVVAAAHNDKYAPRASNLIQLQAKQSELILWAKLQEQGNKRRVVKL